MPKLSMPTPCWRKFAGSSRPFSLAALAAGLIVGPNDAGAGTALVLGSLVVSFGGALVIQRSRDDLQRAIWWYNREFH